jgi:hypothetical protein
MAAITSFTEASRIRHAIARDQTRHWWNLFCQLARTKKEVDRRERLWLWWGGVRFFAQLESRGVTSQLEKSWGRGR